MFRSVGRTGRERERTRRRRLGRTRIRTSFGRVSVRARRRVGRADPSLALAFERAARRKVGGAGRARKDVVFSLDRGRYVKAIFPRGASFEKCAVGAHAPRRRPETDRAETTRGRTPESRRVYITKDDLRNKRMSRRAGSLTVFLVDASGLWRSIVWRRRNRGATTRRREPHQTRFRRARVHRGRRRDHPLTPDAVHPRGES